MCIFLSPRTTFIDVHFVHLDCKGDTRNNGGNNQRGIQKTNFLHLEL